MLERLVDAYPEHVQLIYRHFPLVSIHSNAAPSAEAAEAAGAQGKFWEYHDLLFERQAEWSTLEPAAARAFFTALATELYLNEPAFAAALEAALYAPRVAAMREEARALRFGGTPTVIVDGQLLTSGVPADYAVWDEYVATRIALQALETRQFAAAPPMAIDPQARYLATVVMAGGGRFVIELLPAAAPQTVNSFVFLAREGWFDGVTFHRVLPGFVAQTGDPSGTGAGGPGYTVPNEIADDLTLGAVGMVAMANSGPDTNGSQWFITLGDAAQLDGSYTIFGRVIEGLEVVNGLRPRDPLQGSGQPDGDRIERVTIAEVAAP